MGCYRQPVSQGHNHIAGHGAEAAANLVYCIQVHKHKPTAMVIG